MPRTPDSTPPALGKRQRSLVDMFSAAPATPTSAPPAKKAKLTALASPTASLRPLNAIPFSLATFIDSLDDEQRGLLQLECQTMQKAWLKLLSSEITKPYFIELKRFLAREGICGPDNSTVGSVFPPARNIYSWSDTPIGKVRVVIVGQDPYHGDGQAHGLCFSVPKGVAVPPSLRNIYAEIKREYPDFTPPQHGNLTAWARAGVLMLNTCLTVRAGKAGSHSKKGWETFTDRVVDVVDRYGGATLSKENQGVGQGVVFLAWGGWAAQRVAKLSKTKHLILASAHPSPLSAHRGFLGNGHFQKANTWLEKRYGPEGVVDWCTLDIPGSSTTPVAPGPELKSTVTMTNATATTSVPVVVATSTVVEISTRGSQIS